MYQKNNYREIVIIRKQQKLNRKQQFFVFFMIFLGIFLIIFFSIFSLFNIPKTPARFYYAIYTIIEATNFETAETKAVEFQARGGAGIVTKINQKFAVILASYPQKALAETVSKQLQNQSISAQIQEIALPVFSLNNMTETEQTTTQNIHQKYLETLQNLYELSIQLDNSEITQSYALMRINELSLLWQQRANILAGKIDIVNNSQTDAKKHPLYPIYCLSLYAASQLGYLVTEDSYQNSLKTLICVIRQITYMLCIPNY